MLPEILRTGKTACTFDRKNRGQLFLACIVTSLKKNQKLGGSANSRRALVSFLYGLRGYGRGVELHVR
jgi:hypothetical protein